MQSHASSTGARKPTDTLPVDFHTQSTFQDDEKRGLFQRAGGKRRLKKTDSKPRRIGTDGEEIKQNWLGKVYTKIVNFSVVTKYVFSCRAGDWFIS